MYVFRDSDQRGELEVNTFRERADRLRDKPKIVRVPGRSLESVYLVYFTFIDFLVCSPFRGIHGVGDVTT